jgi:hypothetical protein
MLSLISIYSEPVFSIFKKVGFFIFTAGSLFLKIYILEIDYLRESMSKPFFAAISMGLTGAVESRSL